MASLSLSDLVDASLKNIADAAFDSSLWPMALAGMLEITDSTAINFLGWEDDTSPINLPINLDPLALQGWIELGGAERSRENPIVSVGAVMPVFASVAEHEVLAEDVRRRSALWQDFYEANRVPHIRAGKAWSDGERHVMVAAMQDRRQGPMSGDALVVYDRLLRAVGGSVQTAASLARDRGKLLAGAFDLMDVPVFVLDGFGHVLAMSRTAETEASRATEIVLSGRRLRLRNSGAAAELNAAIGALSGIWGLANPSGTRVVEISRALPATNRLRIMRAPRHGYCLPVDASILVVIEHGLAEEGLTAVEREIMQALSAGRRAQDIAEQRGVSLDTIRTHSKAVYSKLGVSGQLELVVRMRRQLRD